MEEQDVDNTHYFNNYLILNVFCIKIELIVNLRELETAKDSFSKIQRKACRDVYAFLLLFLISLRTFPYIPKAQKRKEDHHE